MKKRNIRKWGNSFVIMLTPTDVKDMEISVQDEADIEDIVIIKKKKKRSIK